MNEAVFVPGIGMWVSLVAIMAIGAVGGVLLYFCEKHAGKFRASR